MIGFVLIDKDPGLTSAAVVAKARKFFNIKRIGHTGTLDPMASGLMICLLGQATRLSDFVLQADKSYSGTFKFGIRSDTDDITGNVIQAEKLSLDSSVVIEAANKFIGEISQVPPQYSAVHIDGKRAYQLARAGVEFEITARNVKVSKFDLTKISDDEYSFFIACSKGTYIRSLIRDLGENLGTAAVLTSLRRESVGNFAVNQAKKIDMLQLNDILPWTDLFPEVRQVEVDEFTANALLAGNSSALRNFSEFSAEPKLVFCHNSRALGLLSNTNGNFEFAVNFTEV